MTDVRILPADAAERAALESAGWVVVARSWGARLDAERCDREHLRALVARAAPVAEVRPLVGGDAPAVLALDRATTADYPGGPATAHAPLTPSDAIVGRHRRGHGAFITDGTLVAMTLVDVLPERAEVDLTAVARAHRRRGLATAVKAASVLDLLDGGTPVVRTGGSWQNAAVLAANAALGFVVDEEWVTLAPPR